MTGSRRNKRGEKKGAKYILKNRLGQRLEENKDIKNFMPH